MYTINDETEGMFGWRPFIEEEASYDVDCLNIVNFDQVNDGVYEVITERMIRDWETGAIEECEYKLIPYVESKMVTYKPDRRGTLVFLDNKKIGIIKQVEGGYQYHVKGSSGKEYKGEVFETLELVKQSLEQE